MNLLLCSGPRSVHCDDFAGSDVDIRHIRCRRTETGIPVHIQRGQLTPGVHHLHSALRPVPGGAAGLGQVPQDWRAQESQGREN